MGSGSEQSQARRGLERDHSLRSACLALGCGLSLLFSLPACASKHFEEIVTTDASRSSALPPGAEPVAIAAELPERDENIEAAGDRIAEAITYLNTRQRDRREFALRALNQAEVVINRALHARPHDDEIHTALRATLKDLDAIERAIQHGTPEAAIVKQLALLNKNLDNLDVHQVQDQSNTETSNAQ